MSQNLKIAMVAACPFPYQRGTPIRILRMSQALSTLGLDVHVVTYHLGQEIDAGGIVIHRIPNQNFYTKTAPGPHYLKLLIIDPILMVKLFRLNRIHRFDIIHAHHFEGLLAAWPIKLFGNTPVIFDSHTLLGSELHHYNLFLPKCFKQHVGTALDRYLPRMADFVICVSEQIKSQLISTAKIPAEKTALIPNGLELEHFINEHLPKRKFDRSNPILGFAGNSASYQGIGKMLAAVRILGKSYPGISLHIYATDSFSDYFATIDRLNIAARIKVIPTSYQQLPEHLSQADVLLNPRSDGAGTPIKLINYMSAGKPVVTFAGSAHEIRNGETGWIVSDDTPEAFAEGIDRLLTDRKLARNLGIRARAFVKNNFSWQSRGEEIIEIYKSLCTQT